MKYPLSIFILLAVALSQLNAQDDAEALKNSKNFGIYMVVKNVYVMNGKAQVNSYGQTLLGDGRKFLDKQGKVCEVQEGALSRLEDVIAKKTKEIESMEAKTKSIDDEIAEKKKLAAKAENYVSRFKKSSTLRSINDKTEFQWRKEHRDMNEKIHQLEHDKKDIESQRAKTNAELSKIQKALDDFKKACRTK